jgi:ribosome biogenesis GTPase
MAKKKVRVEFRKNRQKRTRVNDLTRGFHDDPSVTADLSSTERVRAKGDLSRYRTIVKNAHEPGADGLSGSVDSKPVDPGFPGTVLRVEGLNNTVLADDGKRYRCQVRRLLKTMSIDQRHPVAVGDRVRIRPEKDDSGWIERIEPRRGTLMRGYRRKGHLIAANIDQLLIVSGFEEPGIKTPLIDRYLVAAQRGGVRPILVFNKSDLVDLSEAQWVLGLYSQIGYETLVTSVTSGQGIERLKTVVRRGVTAFSGQSGVGKSSLLNVIEPGLNLKVGAVSSWTSKGKHTTTTAELIELIEGGLVIDTPGLRQFELWDIPPREIEGGFVDFHPWVPHCKFPDCTHRKERGCAVRSAVLEGLIAECRYDSYVKMLEQESDKEDYE